VDARILFENGAEIVGVFITNSFGDFKDFETG
jgi:hypothetical protein